MIVEWYLLPIEDRETCRTRVRDLLQGDSFLRKTVEFEDGPRTSWFMVDEIVKLLRSHFFGSQSSLGARPYPKGYFTPLRWPTVLIACTALRCALMDYEDTGCKPLAVPDFSQAVFGGKWTDTSHCRLC